METCRSVFCRDERIRFFELTPVLSVAFSDSVALVCTDHDPADKNGKPERVHLYCIYPHEKTHELDSTLYEIYEIREIEWERIPVDWDTSVVGFTHNGTDTLVLGSHTIPMSWIDINPETQNTLTSLYAPKNRRPLEEGDPIEEDVVIEGLSLSDSLAIPGITVYTYRIQYSNDTYSQFAPLSNPISIPPSYGENPKVWSGWHGLGKMSAFGTRSIMEKLKSFKLYL